MKKIISLILSAAMLVSLFVSCGEREEDNTSISDTDISINVNCPDYYPYNTFTDCDDEYIYFSTYTSGNKPDSDKGGIYRMPRQGGEAELIYKNDADMLTTTITTTEGDEQIVNYNPPILSIAYWNGYIYFLRLNSIYRVSVDSGECMQLISTDDLIQHSGGQNAGLLRVFNDVLYVDSCLAFDLNASDTLKVVHNTENWERYEIAPIDDYCQYDSDRGEYKISGCEIEKIYSFFDYQSNCVADLYMGSFKAYDFNGNYIVNICLDSTHPCYGDTDDKLWDNFSNKKAYRFLKVSYYSDDGELISQDENYSLVIYDLAKDSYNIIALSKEFLSGSNMDVIDDKAYWWAKGSHIVCYDTDSDELYTII